MNKPLRKILGPLYQQLTRDSSFDATSHGNLESYFNQTEGMINLAEAAMLYEMATKLHFTVLWLKLFCNIYFTSIADNVN